MHCASVLVSIFKDIRLKFERMLPRHLQLIYFGRGALVVEYIDYILISSFLAVFVYALLRKRNDILDINPTIYFKLDNWKPVFKLSRWKKFSPSKGEIKFTYLICFIIICTIVAGGPGLFNYTGMYEIMFLGLFIIIFVPFMCVRHIIITDLNKNK